MVRRSLLFSPGDRPDRMRKAAGTDADVVCYDLEDAVAPARKDEARAAVRDLLVDPAFEPDAEVCVRLTADSPATDIGVLAAADPGALRLDAVMLPKVESAVRVDDVVDICRENDLDPAVFALVETATGVLEARAIAAADATGALVFGAEDLAADIGATRTADGSEVLYAREHVVLAASAADVDAIDTIYTDFSDTDGLTAETEFAVTLGYDGKLAIHPAQVPVINDGFTPDPERIEWAERILEARAEADRADRGVFEVDGEMIDAPLVAQAERVLEYARAAGRR